MSGSFSTEVLSQQNQFCGAQVTTGVSCVLSGGSCVPVGGSSSFQNCACTGTTSTFTNCVAQGSRCIRYEDRTCNRQVCEVRCTGGGPYPVMNPGQAYAGELLSGCSYKCRNEQYVCGTRCAESGPSSCGTAYRQVACGGGGVSDPGTPSCSATSCTPTCPANTVPYDTGSGSTTTASCNYQTGAVSGGSCTTAANTRTCWYQAAPPIITITNIDNVSAQSCTTTSAYMGRDANNTNRIKIDYAGNNSSNPYVALQSWFVQGTNTPPSISKVYDTGAGRLVNNGSYGILVRNSGSGWNDIYIPGVEGGAYTWVKAGTVGTGLRAEILGSEGYRIIGISNVSVTTVGTTVSLQYDIQYYHSDSGISPYSEWAAQGTTNLHATANAQSSFLPSGGNTISIVPQWFDGNKSYILDMVFPVSNQLNVTTVNGTTLDVAWSFADTHSGMKQVFGDASITGASNPDEIDDLTSGVNSYVFGSGSVGSELYNGTHLWQTALTTRTDRIDLNDNSRGQITFNTTGFDNACNYAVAQNSNFSMATPWVATKGGSVFGGAGIALDLPTLSGTGGFSNDNYWNSPFSFTKNEADYTSELASVSSATISSLLYPSTVGNYRMTNHNERSNKSNYWFDDLSDRSAAKVAQSPTSYNVVNFAGNATLATTSNAITSGGSSCTTNKTCVVNVSGNLTVNSGFVCDVRTIVFVEGTSTLEADITTNSEDKGCIFISRGNVVISDGTYKSGGSSYPVYDILEAFVITDGQIIIPAADASQSVKDGLLIHGSLLSFGSVSPSILMSRDLSLTHNQTFPTVAVHYDNRYLSIASFVFGGEGEYYRREVGFKPL